MTPRALIFDVDGTLAETEEVHRQAFNETFAEAGLDWYWDPDLYGRLLAVAGGKERIAHYQRTLPSPQPVLSGDRIAALHRRKTARYAEIVAGGGLALRPGVAELVAGARATGRRLAVATTTCPANVEALCRSCWGLPAGEVFDVVAAGDEVAAKKPAPDVYLLALARLGLAADDCIAFEDSRNGVLAARAAGLAVHVTPSRYTRDDDFAGAASIDDDLMRFAAGGGA